MSTLNFDAMKQLAEKDKQERKKYIEDKKKALEELNSEDTRDYITKLKEGENTEGIKEYFALTLQHPYLTRRAAAAEALTDEEYLYYYSAGVAVREINNTEMYLKALINDIVSTKFEIMYLYTAYLLADKEVESLKAKAKGLSEKEIRLLDLTALNNEDFISFTPGKGDYGLNKSAFLNMIKKSAEELAGSATVAKGYAEATNDTIDTLQINNYISDEVAHYLAILPGIIDGVILLLHIALQDNKEAEEDIEAIIRSYKLISLDKGIYASNLISFGCGSLYTAKAVNRKHRKV